MVVYRLAMQDEIESILDEKDYKNVGRYWENDAHLSTHRYDIHEKYLHFFLSLDSIFYLYTHVGLYICTYDVPDYLVKAYYGTGRYCNMVNHNIIDEVKECAIPSKYICFDNLVKVECIEYLMKYEDYLNGKYSDLTKVVYEKEREKMKIRR